MREEQERVCEVNGGRTVLKGWVIWATRGVGNVRGGFARMGWWLVRSRSSSR